MPDDGFNSTDIQLIRISDRGIAIREERRTDSFSLDRVSCGCTRAMRLEVSRSICRIGGVESDSRITFSNQLKLGRRARPIVELSVFADSIFVQINRGSFLHCDSVCFTILVYTRLPNYTFDVITICFGDTQRFKHHSCDTFTSRITVGVSIPHSRSALW